jgi:transcription antitermination factor NusB
MKGRRRARRVALQALYELDLTTHGVDDVLAARLENLYASAATGVATTPSDRAAYDELVTQGAAAGFAGVDVASVSGRYGVEVKRVVAYQTYLARVREQADYMVAIVRGVLKHRLEIDRVISRIAPEWPVEQMAPIDRNLLRIALWEMACQTSPVRVVISEAVELARQFSGEGARRMVNGALGAYVSGDFRLAFGDTAAERQAPVEGVS